MVEQKTASHTDVLEDLLKEITELSDIRTVSATENDTMATALMTHTAMRKVPAFKEICNNPAGALEDLNASLRSRAKEVDRDAINDASDTLDPEGYTMEPYDGEDYSDDQADEEFHNYFLDRFLRQRQDKDTPPRQSFRGYGRGRGNNYRGRYNQSRGRHRQWRQKGSQRFADAARAFLQIYDGQKDDEKEPGK